VAVFTQDSVKFSAQLDSKGRITIPSRIRNRLGLENGDEIALGLESRRVIREEVSSYRKALQFIRKFDSIQSFSFSEGVVEVILDE